MWLQTGILPVLTMMMLLIAFLLLENLHLKLLQNHAVKLDSSWTLTLAKVSLHYV